MANVKTLRRSAQDRPYAEPESVRGPKGRTRTSDALEQLRIDILECRLRPGAKLRFDALRIEYKFGLSSLREALMRLASEGLVVLTEQRGFHVSPVSRADLLDITRMRQELEAMALGLSIRNGDDRWESNVVATFHLLSKIATRKVDSDRIISMEWEQRHRAFHDALCAACGSPWLLHFREVLYDRADRYRRLSLKYLKAPRDDVREHRSLMEAALKRDAPVASELIKKHVARTTDIVLGADQAIFDSE